MRSSSFLSVNFTSAWAGVLFATLLFLVPLGTRLFLGSAITGFHEYEAFFLYASDVVAVVALVTGVIVVRSRAVDLRRRSRPVLVLLALFLILSLISIGYATVPTLSWYVAGRVILLASLAFIASLIFSGRQWERGLAMLGAATSLQALIVIAQFMKQSSLGLSLLGEPLLIVGSPSASTILIEGGRVLRSYGTFPHPNVAGLFLAFGLFISLYLYIRYSSVTTQYLQGMTRRAFLALSASDKKSLCRRYFVSRSFAIRLTSATLFFVHACALVFTFSRSAWIASALGVVTLLVLSARTAPRAALRAFVVVVATAAFLWVVAHPYIAPRARIQRTEPAVTERMRFYEVAQKIIIEHPYGVGIGNQVVASVRQGIYQDEGMRRVWQWEPIHNLFVLVATEVGVAGGLVLASLLVLVLYGAGKRRSLHGALACALMVAVMSAGLFDHYLWTLQPGRLMLWIVVAFCLFVAWRAPEE